MTKTLKSLIGNYKAHLKIAEQIFLDETISEKTVNSSAFIKLTFHKVNFGGSSFAKCDFNECTVSETILKRVEFECCTFQNCKIIESDFEEINSYAASAIVVDSQISKFDRSINLTGDFSFDHLLEFLKSIPAS